METLASQLSDHLQHDHPFGLDILTKRKVSHNEAREAMQRLVNSHFNNPRETHEHARMSIPANPDRDDDLVLAAYIEQQRAKDSACVSQPDKHAMTAPETLEREKEK